MNRNVIIAIIIVVIIAIVGAFVLTHQGTSEKINTKINCLNDENQAHTVVTDSSGKYSLILDNVPAGDNVVIVKYAGNDKYHDYELQKAITIV